VLTPQLAAGSSIISKQMIRMHDGKRPEGLDNRFVEKQYSPVRFCFGFVMPEKVQQRQPFSLYSGYLMKYPG
jgi:hypothetical protein